MEMSDLPVVELLQPTMDWVQTSPSCGWSITLTEREDSIQCSVNSNFAWKTVQSVLLSPHKNVHSGRVCCWRGTILVTDVYSVISLLLSVLSKCGHPSCHSDWCMGSLCVSLSYLSGGSAVRCGSCLHHHVCGCPLSVVIGCERVGVLCLKGGEARPEGEEG